jgi:hypothetical protein
MSSVTTSTISLSTGLKEELRLKPMVIGFVSRGKFTTDWSRDVLMGAAGNEKL